MFAITRPFVEQREIRRCPLSLDSSAWITLLGTNNVVQAASLFFDLRVKVSNKQDNVMVGDSIKCFVKVVVEDIFGCVICVFNWSICLDDCDLCEVYVI